ncbi:MAG: aminotransferase class I/II-fold pyridoxal phosphate-dependent enzyme, partial [Rikenellaceae bacterium]
VFTREELSHIGELCLKYGVKIVSDEIHCDLVMNGCAHTHIASLSKAIADITITYIAPSKTFNTAGLSTSVAIITNPELMKVYRANSDKIHVGQGNIFGAVALQAAYENGGDWVDQLMVYIEANADYVVDFITSNMPRIKCYKPEATFLLWLDCRKMGMSVKELNQFMITSAHLGLNDGSEFGKEGEGFMRLNIGTTRKTLVKAMNQLKVAYDNLSF